MSLISVKSSSAEASQVSGLGEFNCELVAEPLVRLCAEIRRLGRLALAGGCLDRGALAERARRGRLGLAGAFAALAPVAGCRFGLRRNRRSGAVLDRHALGGVDIGIAGEPVQNRHIILKIVMKVVREMQSPQLQRAIL